MHYAVGDTTDSAFPWIISIFSVSELVVFLKIDIEMICGRFEKIKNSSLAQSEAGFNW